MYVVQYIDVGRHSHAIAAFKTAIDLQSHHSNSWNNLGKLYENMGKELLHTSHESVYSYTPRWLTL